MLCCIVLCLEMIIIINMHLCYNKLSFLVRLRLRVTIVVVVVIGCSLVRLSRGIFVFVVFVDVDVVVVVVGFVAGDIVIFPAVVTLIVPPPGYEDALSFFLFLMVLSRFGVTRPTPPPLFVVS